MIYSFSNGGRNLNQFPGGGLGCLAFTILFVVGGYYLLQGLYSLLLWAAPALLVLTLIINWRVFPDTIKSWLISLRTNPLSALLSLTLAVLVFPFFCLYLLLKAIGYRKMEQLRQQFGAAESTPVEEEFVEFEELESTQKPTQGDGGQMPEPPVKQERQQPLKDQNPYDTYFN